MTKEKHYPATMEKMTTLLPFPGPRRAAASPVRAVRAHPLRPGKWLAALLLAAGLVPAAGFAQTVTPAAAGKAWVSTWGCAMSSAGNDRFFPTTSYNGNDVFNNQVVRLVVLGSVGGGQVRVRLSNEYGTAPLGISAARIALSSGGANVIAGTDHVLTFNGGATSTTIPTGAPQLSDAVDMDIPPRALLAVSLYLPTGTTVTSAHPNAQNHTYVSPANSGDVTSAVSLPLDPTVPSILQWPLLTGVEVRASARAFVVAGSSVADGTLSVVDANHRWTDYLSQRCVRKGIPLGVVSAVVVANPLLGDGNGPNVMARFNRDVLARPGVAYVLVNDVIGVECQLESTGAGSETVNRITNGLREYVQRAHAQGIKAYAGTVLPLAGASGYSAGFEINRQAVNAFIRGGAFDGFVDFDAVLRDPTDPTRILPAYDGGDHHHPNDAGYKLMADAFDLALFR